MPEMTSFARWIIIAGLIMVGFGCLIWILDRLGMSLGQMPGDVRFQAGNITCFIPIVSSILLSILLTLVLNLIFRQIK
jgi:hypothetical protein